VLDRTCRVGEIGVQAGDAGELIAHRPHLQGSEMAGVEQLRNGKHAK